jgi:protein-export membrane protein SecD/preprotein translocase SecF subunit
MIHINRWWLSLVIVFVLGAVLIDAYPQIYNVVVRHTSPTASYPKNETPSLLGFKPYVHKGLDLSGGTSLTLAICQGANNPVGIGCRTGIPKDKTLAEAQAATLTIVNKRVNALGVSGAQVQTEGSDQIQVQLPGVGISAALSALGKTSQLYFAVPVKGKPTVNNTPGLCTTKTCVDQAQLIPTDCFPQGKAKAACQFNDAIPGGDYPAATTAAGTTEYYHWKIIKNLPSSDVSGASVGQSTAGQYSVDLNFNSAGAAVWSKVTTKACEQNPQCSASGNGGSCPSAVPPLSQVAIFLDNQVLTAPCVEGPSSNATEITGQSSYNAAQSLVDDINAGSLPAQIGVLQSTTVSASLGQQSVNQSLTAGALGLALVVLFMLLYYRFPGLIASIALIFYALITLAIYELIPVVLTLPGLAGFILSVGMAVDANVLIFERTKEELRQGRPLELAVEYGFRRAWPAIRDSNIATLITCTVLYFFGATDVQGFALTLFIGVAVSMFSAIVITHSLLHYIQRWFNFAKRPTLYTRILPADRLAGAFRAGGRFDVISHRNWYYAASMVVIVPGIITILVAGFNLGVEFTGGDTVSVQLQHHPTAAQVEKVANKVYAPAQVTVVATGKNYYDLTTKPIAAGELSSITHTLQQRYGVTKNKAGNLNLNETTVGPTIATGLVVSSVFLVIIAAALISLYLGFRFRNGLISAKRFALCAMAALLHDVFVLVGLWAMLGHFTNLGQVTSLFVAAVLTVVAFSVHDTIVVFDRIRENLRVQGPRMNFDQVVNLSIAQTMSRSLNTSLTVVFVLLVLVLLGGASVQSFVLALLIGIVSGTYSSIFNAAALLTSWRQLDRRAPARRGGGVPSGAVPATRR